MMIDLYRRVGDEEREEALVNEFLDLIRSPERVLRLCANE
jgi:hypothetical protein